MYSIQKKLTIYTGIVCLCAMISGCLSTTENTSASNSNTSTNTSNQLVLQEETVPAQKDILLIFTGSDWSSDSPLFMQNILTSEVKHTIEKDFTVHHIDLPRNTKKDDKERLKRNYMLFSKYHVTDVPFIVMQTPDQDTYVSQPLAKDISNGKEFLTALELLVKNREPIAAARNRIAETAGYQKAAAIDSFLNTVYYPELPQYDSLRIQVPDLDPDNRSGLKGKYVLITADIQAKHFIQKEDFTAAGDAYKAAAESGFLKPDEVQLAWYFAAYSYSMSEKIDNEQIIAYLNTAIQASPDSAAVGQLKEIIKKFERR